MRLFKRKHREQVAADAKVYYSPPSATQKTADKSFFCLNARVFNTCRPFVAWSR